MSVTRRVREVMNCQRSNYSSHARTFFSNPSNRFRPRIQELRELEGIYPNSSFPNFPIHISCKFNDILRCSDTHHFTSCFRPNGMERYQPLMRCVHRNWAILFVTDKRGLIMGRCWLNYERSFVFPDTSGRLFFSHIFGNKLGESDVYSLLNSLLARQTDRKVTVHGGTPDSYLPMPLIS